MSKAEKIANFDPNGVGNTRSGLFGLPFTEEESDLVILPVPWEVTVSYRKGTAKGPEAILEASPQLDLYYARYPDFWKRGVWYSHVNDRLADKSAQFRNTAETLIRVQEEGFQLSGNSEWEQAREEVDSVCQAMVDWVKMHSLRLLEGGKMLGVLGGDHSSPLGLIQALAEREDSFGILQIDAHADLRVAYEGFQYSHASIMHNALQLPAVTRLVQVGIRDYCHAEAKTIEDSNRKIVTWPWADLARNSYTGQPWDQECLQILNALPDKVYVSFDIDGLDPANCPNTGTPVPGGPSLDQILYLISKITDTGRQIIGFDLCEVAPGADGWDAMVGARVLWALSAEMALSNNK